MYSQRHIWSLIRFSFSFIHSLFHQFNNPFTVEAAFALNVWVGGCKIKNQGYFWHTHPPPFGQHPRRGRWPIERRIFSFFFVFFHPLEVQSAQQLALESIPAGLEALPAESEALPAGLKALSTVHETLPAGSEVLPSLKTHLRPSFPTGLLPPYCKLTHQFLFILEFYSSIEPS